MGCDIHFVVEKMIGPNQWVGVWATDFIGYDWSPAKSRNYAFFGELANVRTTGSQNRNPKGEPEKYSSLTDLCLGNWEGDGHSHSHLPAIEFCNAYLQAKRLQREGWENHYNTHFVKYANDPQRLSMNEGVWDILHNFDAEIERLSRYDGAHIEEILGIDSDQVNEYRVVFWFDN